MFERTTDFSNLSLTAHSPAQIATIGGSDEAQTGRERSRLVAIRMLKLAQMCRVYCYFSIFVVMLTDLYRTMRCLAALFGGCQCLLLLI